MGYFIETSFDIIKTSNFLKVKETIVNLAKKHNIEFSYNNHEIMGKNRIIYRNHYVMSFLFNDDEKDITGFIREIKDMKRINWKCQRVLAMRHCAIFPQPWPIKLLT